jgi:methylenetetrahydrofolate dehydrogenase (NADP+)/methenyltetrahydrofolate cyclohydrolase
VYANTKVGFSPCTAQAAIEILDYYGIGCAGKKVVVIGRSLVVGRPVSMLLMHKNATVTICHTGTEDVPSIAKEADILIVCSGKMESIGSEYLSEGQIVVDVGISWNEEKGKLCGDIKFDEAELIVDAITPVPGGVGAVTTSVLVSHVVEAAERVWLS